MRIKQQFTLMIESSYLSAIVNCDYSGMDSDEASMVKSWVESMGNCVIYPSTQYADDCDDHDNCQCDQWTERFTKGDISGLWADCVECDITYFTSIKPKPSIYKLIKKHQSRLSA